MRSIEEQANKVLAAEQVAPESELSVFVTDDETVRDLNRRFRHIDEPTDVLSFGLDDGPAFATPPDSANQAGEVVISFPTALQQARDAGHDVELELLHLLTHGVLHILGYDHEAPDDARKMQAKEELLLDGWRH
ncbi:MAG: rRNA maturation RNase YbeY [Chloroflexi bacterium]|nr:rRNA maturation RNase YbeY [Chloroflexota bacterium]